jgi:hypothetical protein
MYCPQKPPVEIAVTPEDKPETDTGVDEAVVELLPSWPLLFAPQHFAAPDTTAHEWPLYVFIIPI